MTRDQLLLRGDQNLSDKVRLYVRYNWFDTYVSNLEAVPVTGITQPRINKNTLVSYTHTLSPNLHNDFRIGYHRIDFDTLNYFSVNGVAVGRHRARHSRLRRRHALQATPASRASTSPTSAGLGGGGTNWFQFDTTFQMSNVLAYTRGSHNVRAGFDLRKLATGRRAANDPRGRFDFTGDITGYSVADFMLGLPRTVIPPTDQIQGHVGHWRNGFFVNDVWQAIARPDAQPRPPLRAEHAGADLRRPGVDARPRTSRPSSRRTLPGRGLRVHRGQPTRTSRRGSAPPIASATRRCCAPATGSTTTRTR